jgi:hypothetical protein
MPSSRSAREVLRCLYTICVLARKPQEQHKLSEAGTCFERADLHATLDCVTGCLDLIDARRVHKASEREPTLG